eukprot:UN00349
MFTNFYFVVWFLSSYCLCLISKPRLRIQRFFFKYIFWMFVTDVINSAILTFQFIIMLNCPSGLIHNFNDRSGTSHFGSLAMPHYFKHWEYFTWTLF